MSMERDDEPRFYQPTKQEELFAVVLARIDERTKHTAQRVEELHGDVSKLGGQFVSRAEFEGFKTQITRQVDLHQKILFTTIGTICLAVLAAIVGLVVNKGG